MSSGIRSLPSRLRGAVAGILFAGRVGAGVIVYHGTPGAVPSSTYSLQIDGRVVAVEHFKDVSYARVAISGPVPVVVSVAKPVTGLVLSPLRDAIPVAREGRTLSFTLKRPRKLVLQCRGCEPFLLLVDAPEREAPKPGSSGFTNVLGYLKGPADAVSRRDAIQRALDDISRRPGGGVLYFPAGRYLTGTLVVRSHTTVYLDSGALLQGTADPGDYYVPSGSGGRRGGTGALIYFLDADGSRLIGRGTVAGSGTEIRKRVGDHPRICDLIRSHDCEIADVLIRDSGGFNIDARECSDLNLHGYKIVNDLSVSNQDGTDPDSSRHVLIDDVFMYTSDDAVAVKADVGLCDDVVVRDCVLWTRKSALKVGSDPYHGARNIVFRGNDVIHADRALALYARRGFIEHVRYIDNTAEYVGDDLKRQSIVFLVSKVGPAGERSPPAGGRFAGYIRDVVVDGLYLTRLSPRPSVVRGEAPGHAVSDVVFRNLRIGGRSVDSAAGAGLEVGPYAYGVSFQGTGQPSFDVRRMRLPAWAK